MKVSILQKLLGISAFTFFGLVSYAQTNALWLRYPSISLDGKNTAFAYGISYTHRMTIKYLNSFSVSSEYRLRMP